MNPLFFIVTDIFLPGTADDRTGKRELRRYSLLGEGGEFPIKMKQVFVVPLSGCFQSNYDGDNHTPV